MSNPMKVEHLDSTTATLHSHDPNNAMVQLASASEQYASVSPFVDSDSAFAGGSAYSSSHVHHNGNGNGNGNGHANGDGDAAHLHHINNTAASVSTPPVNTSQGGMGMTNFRMAADQASHAAARAAAPSPATQAIMDLTMPAMSPSDVDADGNPKKKRKSTAGTKQHQLPMFLTKTYHMIEKCDQEIATWSDSGDNFVVKNVEKFASSVLPQYFKHSNFSSFARQLNFYGFRKLKAEPILTADYDARTASYVRFFHEKFQKERPELLVHIKRATKSDIQGKDDVEGMKDEIQHLNDIVQGMQNEFDRRLADMYVEMNSKYNDLYQSFQMHRVQQQNAASGASTGGGAGVLETYQVPTTAALSNDSSSLGALSKTSGADMMQTLSQACLTLKSPALPPAHPEIAALNVGDKRALDNFALM
jgi:hypothetical protein